eukprot:5386924-Amphidinium_carterae.1
MQWCLVLWALPQGLGLFDFHSLRVCTVCMFGRENRFVVPAFLAIQTLRVVSDMCLPVFASCAKETFSKKNSSMFSPRMERRVAQ